MPTKRIHSIDFLRGLVMILMALDHVRDFFHNGAMQGDPLDLNSTTPALFFTRWVTHYCAPVFIFLSGTSAFLVGERKSKKQLSYFLLTRGLWLIAAEIILVGPGWTFDFQYHMIALQVIWAIGISMVIMSGLIRFPFRAIFIIGCILVFGHNLLDPIEAHHSGPFGFWWDLLHRGNFVFYPYADGRVLGIFYPFVPWTGVMALGYCLGKIFTADVSEKQRKLFLIKTGTALLVLFVLLRFSNIYGDPNPWSSQKNILFTILSFINLHKYPPSLLYLCVTIGPALILLAFTEQLKNKQSQMVMVFGRVAFFYYLLHIYLIHLLCIGVFYLQGFGSEDIHAKGPPFLFRPATLGYGLAGVYVIWILVVALLYPVCKKYDLYKQQNRKWWLSYV